jgi:hypothetical protein
MQSPTYAAWIHAVVTVAAISAWASPSADAAHRGPANVPPTMEIEVLDPNADPLGRPAVELNRDEYGNLIVDIPPAVLVHRYYYTGDRSFQAQLLPGGPTVVVVNHPKTGERCYIDVQMMPGAPRVTYTGNSIEYDYGKHGVKIHFGLFGHPKVRYRSLQPWTRTVGDIVQAEEVIECVTQITDYSETVLARSEVLATGAAACVCETGKTIILPVQNFVELMPFGKALLATDWEERLVIRAAKHERNTEIQCLEDERRWAEYSLPTVR